MNISSTPVSNLSTRVVIEIQNTDVAPQVASELKKIRQKMQVPGFRVGHAPMGLVKRQYEPSVLMEQLNAIVSKELNGYINENISNTILEPIFEDSDKLELNQEKYTFSFLVAQRPEMEADLAQYALSRYVCEVPASEIDLQLERIYKSASKKGNLETIDGGNDSISLDVIFVEEGTDGEGMGVVLDLPEFKPEIREQLNGQKVGFKLSGKIAELFEGEIKPDILPALEGEDPTITLEIAQILDDVPATFSPELMKEVYGPELGETLQTEEDLRNHIATELGKSIDEQSKIMLTNQWYEEVTSPKGLELPEDTIKMWLDQRIDEQKLELDEAARADELVRTMRYLRYNLTLDAIVKKYDLKVTRDEVVNQITANLARQYGAIIQQLGADFLNSFVEREMEDREKVENASSEIMMGKVAELLLTDGNIVESTVTYDEFIAMLQEQN
ncbi:MAG: hypothetical protein LAT76_00580 [Schleiferiaceae bacterium]|nr:hypothetical protein [Schleiferiaceae bacterium]